MNLRRSTAVALLSLTPAMSAVAVEPVIAGSVPPDPERLARGEYLTRVSGCHDCHTPGYSQSAGQVPHDAWLTGDTTAWEGPWGTTFASNLRLTLLRFNDEQWLDYARSLRTAPPMPWFNLAAMSDHDLLSILTFVQWLGPKGEPAPPALAPGDTWIGPTIQFTHRSPD
ncbi:cytochrome C [Panacagrimonas sp.]|uniref:cytochrome C n=1 Tax=Panacagrimonas sp. TaxID=2480088 RepID=UPI003B5171E1